MPLDAPVRTTVVADDSFLTDPQTIAAPRTPPDRYAVVYVTLTTRRLPRRSGSARGPVGWSAGRPGNRWLTLAAPRSWLKASKVGSCPLTACLY